eukprot:4322765-Alexandrium_andersonii.AAC.1
MRWHGCPSTSVRSTAKSSAPAADGLRPGSGANCTRPASAKAARATASSRSQSGRISADLPTKSAAAPAMA